MHFTNDYSNMHIKENTNFKEWARPSKTYIFIKVTAEKCKLM